MMIPVAAGILAIELPFLAQQILQETQLKLIQVQKIEQIVRRFEQKQLTLKLHPSCRSVLRVLHLWPSACL
jgi:hypothetical protein